MGCIYYWSIHPSQWRYFWFLIQDTNYSEWYIFIYKSIIYSNQFIKRYLLLLISCSGIRSSLHIKKSPCTSLCQYMTTMRFINQIINYFEVITTLSYTAKGHCSSMSYFPLLPSRICDIALNLWSDLFHLSWKSDPLMF